MNNPMPGDLFVDNISKGLGLVLSVSAWFTLELEQESSVIACYATVLSHGKLLTTIFRSDDGDDVTWLD